MKLAVWISLGALGLVGSVAGCVTDAETLFSGNNNNSNGAGGSAGSGQGGSVVASSSSSGDASTSSSSSSGSSSGGPGSSSSSSASSSSSSSGTGITVFCAGKECVGGSICCYSLQPGGQDFCNPDANCGMGYAVLTCNGPSDCPGGFCCVTRANNTYTGSSCQPMCAGPPGDFIACEGDQSVCPAGLTCQQSTSLGNGYQLCR